jgi:hypothetical protein
LKIKTKTTINEQGIKVVLIDYKEPRKSEKTWPANRYSIANIGRQAIKLGKCGIHATTDI